MDTMDQKPDVLAGTLYARLDAALSAFEDLEDRLMRGIMGSPDDIFDQMPSCQARCEKWRAMIEGLFGEFQDDLRSGSCIDEDAGRLRARLWCLIEKEGRLYEALSSQRERLVNEIKVLGKGRSAIKGYKAFGVGRRSMFMNNG